DYHGNVEKIVVDQKHHEEVMHASDSTPTAGDRRLDNRPAPQTLDEVTSCHDSRPSVTACRSGWWCCSSSSFGRRLSFRRGLHAPRCVQVRLFRPALGTPVSPAPGPRRWMRTGTLP